MKKLAGGDTVRSDSPIVENGRMFQAMCDLAWHGAGHPTIWIRGTHLNWTEVVVGEHVFNIDDEQDRKRLIEWGDAMRHRKANAPKPEPALRGEPDGAPSDELSPDKPRDIRPESSP